MSTVVPDPLDTLVDYLQQARDGMLWKLEGLDDHDVRRPLTPSGTNLLGLVKHLAAVELDYLGVVFGRPAPVPQPWLADDAPLDADLWATPGETREDVVGLYRLAWELGAETIRTLDADSVGEVSWWPEERRRVTLHQVLVHLVAETHRHAGHADILREGLDDSVGRRPGDPNASATPAERAVFHAAVEEAAREAARRRAAEPPA